MQQTIIWTPIPRRYDVATQRLHFAVRISPRLQGDQELESLSKFCFAHWAGLPLSFKACFGNSTSPVSFDAQIEDDVRDPALWDAVFPCSGGTEDTMVHSHVFDPDGHSARTVRSFPVMDVLAYVKDVYQQVALEYPLAPPDIDALIERRQSQEKPFKSPLLAAIQPLLKPKSPVVGDDVIELPPPSSGPASAGNPTAALAHVLYFHAPQNGAYATPPNFKTEFDFHETLSLVEDSDFLLRRLGLVFELSCALPPNFATAFVGAQACLSVQAQWPGAAQTVPPIHQVRPFTRYRFLQSAGIFCAAENSSGLKDGFLDLSQADYAAMQVDVDGAAIKLVDYVRHLVNLQSTRADVERTELPALRSAGMALVHTGRAVAFSGRGARAAELNAQLSGQPVLFAEDLVRGLRLDVLADSPGASWRSLCQREESYSARLPVEGGSPDLLSGPFQPYARVNRESTLTSAPTQKPQAPDFYLHETLAHWDGWSLAVRRPGKKIPDASQDPDHTYLDDGAPAPQTQGTLNIALDLPKDDVGMVLPTLPRLRFGRRYRFRARAVDISGRSLPLQAADQSPDAATATATPYLRYEPIASPVLARIALAVPGESMDRVVVRSGDSPADCTAQSVRVVFPPRISQQLAEQHGMLDAPPPSGNWYNLLTQRHGPQAQLRGSGDPSADGSDILDAVPTDVPYLPDPLAAATRVRLLGPDGEMTQTLSFAHSQAWPHAAPWSICLTQGSGDPAWDSAKRTLSIPVPAGRMRTLQLSSVPRSAADLELMGIWGWVRDVASPERLEKLAALCATGQHWMLTPARTVTLVHAVQKPCSAPRIEVLVSHRALGESFAQLAGSVAIDGPSTGKVELHASWTDRVDDVSQIGTGADYAASSHSHAFDLVHSDMGSDHARFLAQHHALPDTQYRRVRYTATAVSRYQEYFDADTAAPGSFALPSETAFELDILSSARPDAPQVAYVVPTFGWDRSPPEGDVPMPAGDEAHSPLHFARKGGGLRVYLERPWFSSGDGELLGVVLYAGPKGVAVLTGTADLKVPEASKHLVTQWGYDPIWVAQPPDALPTLAHFPEAVLRSSGFALQELGAAAAVDVAAHAVHFDVARQLWFCDITVDPGPAYFPFIRLALARLQPHAVLGAELSKVVLADFIQCAPDRLVTLTAVPDHPRQLRLSVTGPAPVKQKAALVPTVMAVRVEVLHATAGAEVWVPVQSGWQGLPRSQVTPAATVWSGVVMLPAARGSHRMRLVMAELEMLPAASGALGAAMDITVLAGSTGARPVYSDVFEI